MIRLIRALLKPLAQWVLSDGRPSKEFYDYMHELDGKVRELVTAVNDHETRITDLEP